MKSVVTLTHRKRDETMYRRYEMTSHTGNVLAVVTDKRLANNQPDVIAVYDYYPYGQYLPNRTSYDPANDYRYSFGGHEKINELQGVVDMGDRWLDGKLGRTPKMDKEATAYPNLSPYSYAANNPILFIDPDGKVVKMYFSKTTVGAGYVAGISISAYRGTAYDDYGVTHFSAWQLATPNDLDNTRTPNLILGAGGYLGGVGIQIDKEEKSFRKAFEKWTLNVTGGALVMGGLNFSAKDENSMDGFGAEIGFGGFGLKGGLGSGGDTHYNEAISVSHSEAKKIGSLSRWFVYNKEPIRDKKTGDITGYSGDVFTKNILGKVYNTGIKVQSGTEQTDDGVKSDNVWTSKKYELEKLSD